MAINTIIVSGNVGKDAVLRVTPNGKHIASFSIPAKTGYGENEKTSGWCKMFGAMAEKLSSAVVKGAKVTVSGEFVIEEWTRQDGSTAQTPTILVRDIDLPQEVLLEMISRDNDKFSRSNHQHLSSTANHPWISTTIFHFRR